MESICRDRRCFRRGRAGSREYLSNVRAHPVLCPPSLISNNTANTAILTSTNVNPFAEWNAHSSDSSPPILGALPSTPIAPILPVSISDDLILRFSANDSVLHCVLLVPQNRTLFLHQSPPPGSRTTSRDIDNAVFAVVDFPPHATVEVEGFTPRDPSGTGFALHLTRGATRLFSHLEFSAILIIRSTAPGCVCGGQWGIRLC
jgi:hypothetical protein